MRCLVLCTGFVCALHLLTGFVCALHLRTGCVCALHLRTGCVCALHLCTGCICALHLCTASVHCICALAASVHSMHDLHQSVVVLRAHWFSATDTSCYNAAQVMCTHVIALHQVRVPVATRMHVSWQRTHHICAAVLPASSASSGLLGRWLHTFCICEISSSSPLSRRCSALFLSHTIMLHSHLQRTRLTHHKAMWMCRYFDFMVEHLQREHNHTVPEATRQQLESAVRSLDVMPSMRALMTAGPALAKSHIAGYNCSYLPIAHTDAFHEVLYILMHGTGVGFSVERQFTGATVHRSLQSSALPIVLPVFARAHKVMQAEGTPS